LGAISSCGFRPSFVPSAAHAATAEVKLLREQPMSSHPSSSFVAGCAISNFISKSVVPRKRVSGNWSCGILIVASPSYEVETQFLNPVS
jgi:hypothetical protein